MRIEFAERVADFGEVREQCSNLNRCLSNDMKQSQWNLQIYRIVGSANRQVFYVVSCNTRATVSRSLLMSTTLDATELGFR